MSFDVAEFPPTYIGPTWRRDEDGDFVLPERTLGWEIAGWCTEYLLHPDDDALPWRFSFEQLRFILWWYAVDEAGKFIYRNGTLQRLKGWGKDPLAAVMSLVELCGPARFSHWDDAGNPVGKPVAQAWVEVYAVSREQTRNTMAMIPSLMSEKFKAAYSISPGKEIIYANGGRCALLAKSAGFRAAEGGRVTFMVLGETQHWVQSNGGHKLFQTVKKNAVKMGGRWLAITNAYLPGEDSVAEQQREAHERVLSGKYVDVGQMYDSIEAHPKTPLTAEALLQVIPLIRGDAVWLEVDGILADIQDTASTPAQSRRMWLNQIVADEDALISPQEWDALKRRGGGLKPKDRIVLGFDGGRVDDATALVAIRVEDALIEPLLIEERPLGVDDWEVDRDAVDLAVHRAFADYEVVAFFCDVAQWDSYISMWAQEYSNTVAVSAGGRNKFSWDMRSGQSERVVKANELTMRSVKDELFCWHDPDAAPDDVAALRHNMRRHVLNARRRENRMGVSFGKETKDSPKKIDAYAALVAAVAALDAYRQLGKQAKPNQYRSWFF